MTPDTEVMLLRILMWGAIVFSILFLLVFALSGEWVFWLIAIAVLITAHLTRLILKRYEVH